MHFGLDDGGLEVDGYAHARPAPTGLFSVLEVLIPATAPGLTR